MRMHRTNWLLVPLLLLVGACESPQATHYPFDVQFVSPSEVPPRLLPIPPAQDSSEYKKEIDSIIATQNHLSATDKAAIKAEDHITPTMIVLAVIGPDFTEARFPAMYTLLRHAASDAWRDSDYAEDYWNRPRPWTVDERVQLLVSPITRPSYPSGHSTTNFVWAHVLTDLFPDRQDALMVRAQAIGMHRVAGGAHYASDVDAGRRYAAFIFDKMRTNAKYKAEFAAAQAEVNAATAVIVQPLVVVDPMNNPVPAFNNVVPATPAYRGNLPVDCMHPQPGELQTMCQ